GVAPASDPTREFRFEVTESTFEQTRAAMKRAIVGMSKTEVERLFPLRSMEVIAGKSLASVVSGEYLIDGKYRLVLVFRKGSDGQFRFWKGLLELPSQLIAQAGE